MFDFAQPSASSPFLNAMPTQNDVAVTMGLLADVSYSELLKATAAQQPIMFCKRICCAGAAGGGSATAHGKP
jgi:hypothetical protein